MQRRPTRDVHAERQALKGTADGMRNQAFIHKANRDRALAAEREALVQGVLGPTMGQCWPQTDYVTPRLVSCG